MNIQMTTEIILGKFDYANLELIIEMTRGLDPTEVSLFISGGDYENDKIYLVHKAPLYWVEPRSTYGIPSNEELAKLAEDAERNVVHDAERKKQAKIIEDSLQAKREWKKARSAERAKAKNLLYR